MIVDGVFVKLADALQTACGWVAGLCIFTANLFAGYENATKAVIFAVVADTCWGIAASIKRGNFALSELGRNGMLSKLLLYASTIIGLIFLERMAGMDSQLTVITICSLICLAELWSMSGSALIVNPRIPFLRIFRKVLTGEIARKMNTTVEEVEKYLDGKN